MALEEHFFRRESGRLVAALTRIFGAHNLALAEDVVQDAFCRAIEVWGVRGVPENPSAWLMATARNRAIDVVRRQQRATSFAPEMGRLLETEWTLAPAIEDGFSEHAIRDAELRMMLSCCDPRLAEEAQIALILNLLCGFGSTEIASAFLAGRAATEKRIARGKKVLASSKSLFELTSAGLETRLSTVRRALYLLFNEGYHSVRADEAVRAVLCGEAMRLTASLREHPAAATPTTDALGALMCLHAARLPARLDIAGDLAALADQDRSRWDRRIVAEGLALLERSAAGHELSAYHLEAAIAAVHAGAASVDRTDWRAIVELYDRLMQLAPSPVIALNRAIAIAERDGPERGLAELAAIADRDRLVNYPFYPAALGELERRRGRLDAAREHLLAARKLGRNDAERRFLERRLQALDLEDDREDQD